MEEQIPAVSIVMPVYNAGEFLKDAIVSVLNQTERNFELIVINDGSEDSSAEIVKNFSDNRLRFFDRPHTGLIDTLNFGLQQARGEFIARFDADDICTATRLEEQLQYFDENPENVLVGSWAETINDHGESIGKMTYPPEKWENVKKYSLLHNPFIHSSVMFRSDLIRLIGGYKKAFKSIEDYELWTRAVYRYPCANVAKFLIKYRIHHGQVTRKNNFQMRSRGFLIRLLALKRYVFTFK